VAEQDDDELDEEPAKTAGKQPGVWEKGGPSPNPAGRPAGSFSLRNRVREAMRGDPVRAKRITNAFLEILEAGAVGKGQVEAFKLFMQYIEPPPAAGEEPGAGEQSMKIILEDRRDVPRNDE